MGVGAHCRSILETQANCLGSATFGEILGCNQSKILVFPNTIDMKISSSFILEYEIAYFGTTTTSVLEELAPHTYREQLNVGCKFGAGAEQPVHWLLGGKGLGIQQGTSVWVRSPKSKFGRDIKIYDASLDALHQSNIRSIYHMPLHCHGPTLFLTCVDPSL